MTAQDRAATAGLGVLDRVGGFTVTILPDNISVRCQIDRMNNPAGKAFAEIDIQSSAGVMVYIRKKDYAGPPRLNQLVQESNGKTHRVGLVKDLGLRWQLHCEEYID